MDGRQIKNEDYLLNFISYMPQILDMEELCQKMNICFVHLIVSCHDDDEV